jgi:hypothetical protein
MPEVDVRRLLRLTVVIVTLGGSGCGSDEANDPNVPGTLSGRVTEAGNGGSVDLVVVRVGERTTLTDEYGDYELTGAPSGHQTVTATREGYQPFSASVTIQSGGETTRNISLTRSGGAETPQRFSASSGSDVGSVLLEWERAEHADKGYNVYWATSPGVTPATGTRLPVAVAPSSSSGSFVQQGLTPGQTYYYVITGVGASGESPPSAEVRATARGPIAVQILGPLGTVVDTVLAVDVSITSTLELSEVTASVGTLTAPLTAEGSGRWRGQLVIASLPSAPAIALVVTAKDVNGAVGEASVTMAFDRPPILTVFEPVNGAVGHPTVSLRLTCTDELPTGCVTVEVYQTIYGEDRGLLFSGQGNVNTTLSLPGHDDVVYLVIRAKDAHGRESAVNRALAVVTNPALTEVADADSGFILDADAERLLVGLGNSLRLVNRSSGASTTIFTADSTTIRDTHLTPSGALFVTEDRHSGIDILQREQLHEFRDGVLSTLDTGDIKDVQVEGGFAAWRGDRGSRLMWRNLTTGTSQQVWDPAPVMDLAPNGDVVFVRGYYGTDPTPPPGEVFRFRNGTTEQITNNAAGGLAAGLVATDGDRIVEELGTVGAPEGLPFKTVLLDPTGDVVLATGVVVSQPAQFLANGGWVAFRRFDMAGVGQVWVRSPEGVETQLSFQGNFTPNMRMLSGNGEVLYDYLTRASPSLPAARVAGASAVPIYIDGALHVALGASLFRVH